MQKTTKRIWLAALALVMAAGLGACADEPMAVEAEESYEVQMDGTEEPCVIVDGRLVCP